MVKSVYLQLWWKQTFSNRFFGYTVLNDFKERIRLIRRKAEAY